jgi:Ca-activated chloride channel family protein
MSFGSPLFLLALLALPLLALAYVLLRRRPARYPVRFTNLDVLATVAAGTTSWRRHAGALLFLLALAALLVGFARPQMNRLTDREEATVVLVVDVSGSMMAKDVKPTRRRPRCGSSSTGCRRASRSGSSPSPSSRRWSRRRPTTTTS